MVDRFDSVTFIDTATNTVKRVTYIGRSPHEAFFTPDGNEVWVTVRVENYVAVLDAHSFAEKTRITTPNGPGLQIFSPDGKYGYVCSSFNLETDVIAFADHQIVARVKQDSPFCPNITATPDFEQVWLALKDVGRTQLFHAEPPFNPVRSMDTGPITNHVNFATTAKGTFAYVTIAVPMRSRYSGPMIFPGRRCSRRQAAAWRVAVWGRPKDLCRT